MPEHTEYIDQLGAIRRAAQKLADAMLIYNERLVVLHEQAAALAVRLTEAEAKLPPAPPMPDSVARIVADPLAES